MPDPHPMSSADPNASKWARFLADVPRPVRRQIGEFIDPEHPPELARSLLDGLTSNHGQPDGLGRLLISQGLIAEALLKPHLLTNDQALAVAEKVFRADSLFDSKLLMIISNRDCELHELGRALLVLNHLRCSKPYVVMPMLKLMGHTSPLVRFQAARILGRASTNLALLETILDDQDPRVIANLLESLVNRTDLTRDQVLHLLRLASQHRHRRVQTTAVAMLSRLGDTEATTRLEAMLHSDDARDRTSARWALETAAATDSGDLLT